MLRLLGRINLEWAYAAADIASYVGAIDETALDLHMRKEHLWNAGKIFAKSK